MPYFLWDDPMTVAELEEYLRKASPSERFRLLGKILREARDTDVWRWLSLSELVAEWPRLKPHLGRRLAFWDFLLSSWRAQGLIVG
jgi:hypothetical protein